MGARLAGWRRFLKRFSHCRRGNVAMMFALSLPLLAMTSLVGVDVHRISTVRANLQDALDAAALAAARSPHMTDEGVTTVGMAALRANLQAYPQIALREDLTTFHLTEEGAVVADAKVDVDTLVANIFLPPYGQLLDDQVQVGVESEVLRSSNNLEVALVLDITGSMSGNKLTQLKAAADELIDMVVQDVQTPYYTKAAIVPYAAAVNLGDFADEARGAIPGAVSIRGASRANPVVITADGHGFENGDRVYISGVSGMRELNGETYRVGNARRNSFELRDSAGRAVDGSRYDRYRSGGSVWCAEVGCRYYTFPRGWSGESTREISACVTERTGPEAYTDASLSSARVSPHYLGDCPRAEIMPLTSNRTALHGRIADLRAEGYTAGHIGLAWGWYAVSPNFNGMWTGESQPGAYGTRNLIKAVILMTDGEFNMEYCNGVSTDAINCGAADAPRNGNPFDQAEALCESMKAQGVLVYTVGFAIGGSRDVRDLMNTCASEPGYAFMPEDGADLREAFRAIARSISDLRIAR